MRKSSSAATAEATSTRAKKPQAGPLNSNPSSGGTTTAAVRRRMAKLLFTRGTDLSRGPGLHKYFRSCCVHRWPKVRDGGRAAPGRPRSAPYRALFAESRLAFGGRDRARAGVPLRDAQAARKIFA